LASDKFENGLNKRYPFAALDAGTILQVDATALLGILFFLTLSGSGQWLGRFEGAFLTLFAAYPFATSAAMIMISNYVRLEGPHINPIQRSMLAPQMSGLITAFGLVLLVVILAYIYSGVDRADSALECAESPKKFGINITHPWACSMFAKGSLAEQCANDPSRFHMNSTSQCSKFIPPLTASGG
jgi:hypothetical protein